MKNITEIPQDELLKDLEETISDISTCEIALSLGVESYSGGKVQERLEVNKRIKEKIEAEIKRRSGDK